jgi:hypothetical protein
VIPVKSASDPFPGLGCTRSTWRYLILLFAVFSGLRKLIRA